MDKRPSRSSASLPDVGLSPKEDFPKTGFGEPQANVSTGGVRGRGSALPVLGNRCLAEIMVQSSFPQWPKTLAFAAYAELRLPLMRNQLPATSTV